jgi:hypothetical protein
MHIEGNKMRNYDSVQCNIGISINFYQQTSDNMKKKYQWQPGMKINERLW